MTTEPTVNYSTWALRGDVQADWYESYANRTAFELCDAASILANVQPEYPAKLDSERVAAIGQWSEKLQENMHDLLAPAGYNQDNPLHHRLSHQKLRNWCAEMGACWPIPERAADRIASLEQELAEERQLRIRAQQIADPVMSPSAQLDYSPTEPPVLKFGEPLEVYRHLDYLTEAQALDWMNRIAGFPVTWETFWGMISFDICRAFMDCRALSGFTNASEGEFEHRKVYGLGICQVMSVDRVDGAPLHLQGPALHVDSEGYQEIDPNLAWWLTAQNDIELLFKPADIEIAAGMVNEDGGWSNAKQNAQLKANPLLELAPEHSGADLVALLSKLHIAIDNEEERIRYRVMLDGGRLLAVFGSNLQPLAPLEVTSDMPISNADHRYQCEIARLNQVIAEQSAQLQAPQVELNNSPRSTSELVFPYATRELEAMRAVALQYWAPYSPDKRMPTQKEIGLELCEILDLQRQSSGDPARKAIVLATAIRPDTLPDTQG